MSIFVSRRRQTQTPSACPRVLLVRHARRASFGPLTVRNLLIRLMPDVRTVTIPVVLKTVS